MYVKVASKQLFVLVALHRFKAKKKAFHRYAKKYTDGAKTIEEELNQLKKNCSVIRVLAHTQITKIGYGQKKAHMSEIQVRLQSLSLCRHHLKALSFVPSPQSFLCLTSALTAPFKIMNLSKCLLPYQPL